MSDAPESAIAHVPDIDQTDVFVTNAVTKGLQAPGLRVGWVVASKKNIQQLRNYSTVAMGGCSRPSQLIAAKMLDMERVGKVREACAKHYSAQRERYLEGLEKLGIECRKFTGQGGFYVWGKLPNGLKCYDFNRRLFEHKAAILPGADCDMLRATRGKVGTEHENFIRFR
jgi:2-aminoadipate transaminase